MRNFIAAATAATLSACAGAQVIVIDFDTDGMGNALPAGTIIDDEYENLGVLFSVENSDTNTPIIFDSSNPTGGDPDLGTPGSGPGNDTAQGNILIIAEDVVDANEDGLVDDPDDEGNRPAGTIVVDFVGFNAEGGFISFVDIEEAGGSIELLLVDTDNPEGTLPISIPNPGNNSQFTVDLPEDSTYNQIRINMPGSGAVSAVAFTPAPGSAALIALSGILAARRRRA